MTARERDMLYDAVFGRHIELLRLIADDCKDGSAAFNIGRVIGIMQTVLRTWPAEDDE